MTDDEQLLRQYIQESSEPAFGELVARHLDLVFSAALRVVNGDTHLAQDVTQTVFIDLARKAPALPPGVILAGWLHRHTCFTASTAVRTERRRQTREQTAMEIRTLDDNAGPPWEQIAPFLDEGLNQLNPDDRDALVLRFLRRYDFRAIGAALNISEDAAQKRVSRALEKLRAEFTRRGVTTTALALSAALSANALQAAPAGLALTVSTVAFLAGSTLPTATAFAATKTIAMTALQKSVFAAALALAIGAGIYQARQASLLRSQAQTMRREQVLLTDRIRQLQLDRNDATNRLAKLTGAIANVNGNSTELLKLRGEVTRLQNEAGRANDPFVQTALNWKAKKEKLQRLFQERPDQRVPEMKLLSDQQWLDIARDQDLDSEEGIRKAMSEVRKDAKNDFAPDISGALKKFVDANNGQLPTDLAQLKPYFNDSVDDATLDQYKILRTGNVSNLSPGQWVITDKAAIDNEYDYLWQIGPGSYGLAAAADESTPSFIQALAPAFKAFSDANNGETPTEISQLKPYITTPAQNAALQKALKAGVVLGGK